MSDSHPEEGRKTSEQVFRELREYAWGLFQRNFETAKHLTTLSAGSTVLFATFLQDIFPKSAGGGASTRFLEEPQPSFCPYSPKLVEGKFSEVDIHEPA